ncbi:mediator of RNA polymerase II transcription subunit 23 [Dorcoceras hygrometricum]|uniref:Mediator of RNA polymerase II transcription subunit 23 n=1 Tax=Dorcoceras hygrometricum TaxID=472368 RepID=A0A2Z7CHH5_9LAMI|nr:mediator of RNA polymerase II transcription subunit 23 [Dorcoceras hygrometricum]
MLRAPTPGQSTQPVSDMEQQSTAGAAQVQQHRASSSSWAHQFHPARPAILDLFNLYLGVRSSGQKSDEAVGEPPNKTQKRITAINRELPPPNEQFLFDFEKIQNQYPDHEQLRAVAESVLISLVIQCCSHAPRAEFLLFALHSLCEIGYINWDTFLPCLLSSVSSAEFSVGQGSQTVVTVTSASSSHPGTLPSSNAVPNVTNFPSSNHVSPLPSILGVGSPPQSAAEPSSGATRSPIRLNDGIYTSQKSARANLSILSSLRQLSCKIALIGLESDLKPVTHADIFYHILNWLVNWDKKQTGLDEFDSARLWKPDKALIEWLHSCLDVIWLLVDDNRCRVPFYELIRSGLQFIDNIPDDEAFFTLILEIHRRRDMMATHMQMLDQHLHCPTFGTPRLLPQATTNVSGEPVTNMRYSPITYPSVLGEPLHGEELAASIRRGSLDWDRALRCLRHAFRNTPSPDWWRRVLLLAPCHRNQSQGPTPGAVFTSEMISEATIDRIVELLKLTNSGKISLVSSMF